MSFEGGGGGGDVTTAAGAGEVAAIGVAAVHEEAVHGKHGQSEEGKKLQKTNPPGQDAKHRR